MEWVSEPFLYGRKGRSLVVMRGAQLTALSLSSGAAKKGRQDGLACKLRHPHAHASQYSCGYALQDCTQEMQRALPLWMI